MSMIAGPCMRVCRIGTRKMSMVKLTTIFPSNAPIASALPNTLLLQRTPLHDSQTQSDGVVAPLVPRHLCSTPTRQPLLKHKHKRRTLSTSRSCIRANRSSTRRECRLSVPITSICLLCRLGLLLLCLTSNVPTKKKKNREILSRAPQRVIRRGNIDRRLCDERKRLVQRRCACVMIVLPHVSNPFLTFLIFSGCSYLVSP